MITRKRNSLIIYTPELRRITENWIDLAIPGPLGGSYQCIITHQPSLRFCFESHMETIGRVLLFSVKAKHAGDVKRNQIEGFIARYGRVPTVKTWMRVIYKPGYFLRWIPPKYDEIGWTFPGLESWINLAPLKKGE